MAMSSMLSKSVLVGTPVLAARPSAQRPAARAGVVVRAADRPLFVPGAEPPSYLDGSMAGEASATCSRCICAVFVAPVAVRSHCIVMARY